MPQVALMPTRLTTIPLTTVTRHLAAFLLAVIPTIASLPAAANWQVSPSLGAGIEYDDNASLNVASAPTASVNGVRVEAAAALDYRQPLSVFSLQPRVLVRKYDGDDNIDCSYVNCYAYNYDHGYYYDGDGDGGD